MTSDQRSEIVTVSRKTPRDGRLEVSGELASRLTNAGSPLLVSVGTSGSVGTVEALACQCAKASGAGHVHHCLVSDVLRLLEPESAVSVDLRSAGPVVRIEPARPAEPV